MYLRLSRTESSILGLPSSPSPQYSQPRLPSSMPITLMAYPFTDGEDVEDVYAFLLDCLRHRGPSIVSSLRVQVANRTVFAHHLSRTEEGPSSLPAFQYAFQYGWLQASDRNTATLPSAETVPVQYESISVASARPYIQLSWQLRRRRSTVLASGCTILVPLLARVQFIRKSEGIVRHP